LGASVLDVAATASGQIVITGAFSGPGSIDFGSGPVAGMADGNLFVVEFDANGAPVWGKVLGVSGTTVGEGITVDTAGNVFVSGTSLGSVDFGGGTLTSAGAGGDIFVASFEEGGTLRWARLFGALAKYNGNPVPIAVDPACHVVVAGGFQGTLDFGGPPLTSGGSQDVFVAELVR
jgi:hypothetical protein